MIIITILFLLPSIYMTTALQYEGETCRLLTTNEEGFCIQLNDCKVAMKLLMKMKYPQTCGFVGMIPLVCCPVGQKLTALAPGKLSQEKCDKYHDIRNRPHGIACPLDIECKAKSKEFPHMAAVGYRDSKSDILWLCGGTLISNFFVLSAAHCAYSSEFGPAKWIRLGDLDLKNTTEDANPQDVAINQTYVHPEYRTSSHYHDIALFKMEIYTYFGRYFKPACLQTEKNLQFNNVQATGWGSLGFLGDTSSHLMKVDISIVDHETCDRRYANVAYGRKLRNGILDETQMCAGNAEGGDTCPGDSGGPLHYRVDRTEDILSHFVVAGITSFGKGCGGENSAGVYTRVSAYVGWIENIVWRETNDDLY